MSEVKLDQTTKPAVQPAPATEAKKTRGKGTVVSDPELVAQVKISKILNALTVEERKTVVAYVVRKNPA